MYKKYFTEEEKLEAQRRWSRESYQRNKGTKLVYAQNNKDKINKYHREYYSLDPLRYKETRADYYLENKEVFAKRSKAWYDDSNNKIHQRELVHGINYYQILDEQQGKCAICSGSLEGVRTHIDHDHITGQVRGILHHQCNTSLGVFKDSPEILERAVRYLREPKNYGISKFKSSPHPKISTYSTKEKAQEWAN